ncbi:MULTISPECIES: hypothetical protein [Achromobacter]|nr:hypothetical protein [Achromobacter dolens]
MPRRMPRGPNTPEAVFVALGMADELYNPSDLDRAYRRDDPRCFPLITACGDIEFHFVVTTAGGVEVGFEHDDPDAHDSQARLRWFCWTR